MRPPLSGLSSGRGAREGSAGSTSPRRERCGRGRSFRIQKRRSCLTLDFEGCASGARCGMSRGWQRRGGVFVYENPPPREASPRRGRAERRPGRPCREGKGPEKEGRSFRIQKRRLRLTLGFRRVAARVEGVRVVRALRDVEGCAKAGRSFRIREPPAPREASPQGLRRPSVRSSLDAWMRSSAPLLSRIRRSPA